MNSRFSKWTPESVQSRHSNSFQMYKLFMVIIYVWKCLQFFEIYKTHHILCYISLLKYMLHQFVKTNQMIKSLMYVASEVLHKWMLLLTRQIWTNILLSQSFCAHQNQMTLTLSRNRDLPSKTQKNNLHGHDCSHPKQM